MYIYIIIYILNWKFIGHVELIDSLFLAPSRRCLARTGRSSPLVVALREQIGDRLLIAGAHTRRLRCWGNIFVFCLLYFATKVQSRRFMPCTQARATFTFFADLCGISVSCEVIEVCWYRGSGGDCFEFDRGDVIEVYIKTIKALRLVDPRGLLLEGVPKP